MKINEEIDDKEGIARSLHNLGLLAQATGSVVEARRFYDECLKITQELGDKSDIAFTLAATSLLEEREGNLQTALDLIHQAETIFQELGSPMAERARRVQERLEKEIEF